MIIIETNFVYLTGSKKRIKRAIWKDLRGKFFIKWNGQTIEVTAAHGCGYKTVDAY